MKIFYQQTVVIVALTTSTMTLGQTIVPEVMSNNMFTTYQGEQILQEFTALAEKCTPDLYKLIAIDSSSSTDFFSTLAPTAAGSGVMQFFGKYFTAIGQDKCTEAEAETMMSALNQFKTCTNGLDMMAFIQYFPSALVGGALECALSIAGTGGLFDIETYINGVTLPNKCAEVFFGSNVMGDMMRSVYLKPENTFPCFEALSTSVPTCWYDTWPIPVVGKWLSEASCFVGGSTTMMELLCDGELNGLALCLSGQENNLCAAQEECKQYSYNMWMMPPLFGAPIPDMCASVADERNLQEGIELYRQFTADCTTPWEGWKSEVGLGVTPALPGQASVKTEAPAAGSGSEDADDGSTTGASGDGQTASSTDNSSVSESRIHNLLCGVLVIVATIAI